MADSKMMNEEASEFGLSERDDDESSSTRVDVDKMLEAPSMAFAAPSDALSLSALAQQTTEILTDASFAPAVYATHPDFTKLTPLTGSAPLPEDLEAAKTWLRDCPVAAKEWVIFEGRLRPDVAMAAIHELLATIVLTDGFKVSDADATMARGTQLFTNVVVEPTTSTLQMSANALFPAKTEHVFTCLGVSESKLRVLRMYVGVSGGAPTLSTASDPALHARADALFNRLRAALVEVGYALAMLSTPAFCDADDTSDDLIALDPDYVANVRRAFDTEMKASLRELALPLEEYAHTEELAVAHVLSLLEPLFTKYSLPKPRRESATASTSRRQLDLADTSPDAEEAKEASLISTLSRGEQVARLVHDLWESMATRNRLGIQAKLAEKQAQVTHRATLAKELAATAIASVVQSATAQDAHSLQTALGSSEYGDGVVLFEGACMVGKIPSKLLITYERIVCKCGMFMFASTKDLPFETILKVEKPVVLGLSVISLALVSGDVVKLTLPSDVDRVYELLAQVWRMHQEPPAAPSTAS
ncbi:hypothetical protein SDRG_08692 [Saprolegnia diclina VS20]|uniref:Uncharacterized protein n=1 Tax=Saprolegnia diclina (strain VS20) TaxID=1156394 RepID=T0Q6V6_SAPDV|nr:hypothetical protein SDRG_08692 [Saprolegnia diclina VS20]EQC33584.1 hypothetical protein SDRG_08692 [Saprolegnia diclina VS20]|eukprot:XP_008612807.1 hypothetical protein SDRG_08692 [Saprolegnia diclina VS20]